MISLQEYFTLLSTVHSLTKSEVISLENSPGRILAEDIVADTDQPPFNKSAMDGYACFKKDLPGPLTIAGEIPAGRFIDKELESASCYRIFTGAPIPTGADCVIMQEFTRIDSHGRVMFSEAETKSNICLQGEDIKAGEIAIRAGTYIKAHHIAVMAGFGVTQPLVRCKVRVAIICSGSELVEPSEKPEKAMIRNSNAYQLLSQVTGAGAQADYLGIIEDNHEALLNSIAGITGKYDIIIVTGGASVGDYDFMPGVLKSMGATIHLTGLNIQPGKPVLYATLGDTHLLGLSGNPVSSYLQFVLLAKPLILKLTGSKDTPLTIAKIPLAEAIHRKKSNRQLYLPVSFLPSGFVKALPFNGSAHIAALARMDGFAVMEAGVNEIPANQLVTVLII